MTRALILLTVLLLFSACRAPGPEVGSAPSPEQLKAFQSSAVDPRMMGLTVYRSEAGPVFDGSNRILPGNDERYEMLPAGNPPLPVIRFDTRWLDRITALIDTRSVYSWTDLYTGGQLQFVQLGGRPYRVRPVHVKDVWTGTASYKHTLKLNALRIEDAVLYLRPEFRSLGPLGRGLEPPLPQLTLGLDILKKCNYVTLDYAKGEAVFSTKRVYKPDPATLLAGIPLQTSAQGLLVKGRLGSYSGSILIDSGGDYEVVCPPALSMEDDVLWIGDLRFHVPQSPVQLENGQVAPPYPAVGHRALKDFKVTFDFKKRRVYFEEPRK